MPTLTIHLSPREELHLRKMAERQGKTIDEYLMSLVDLDMAAASSDSQVRDWFQENKEAIDAESSHIRSHGIPGSNLAVTCPDFDK